MKSLIMILLLSLPQIVFASARTLTAPLTEEIQNKDGKLCTYQGSVHLGNSQNTLAYQLFTETSPGVFEQIHPYYMYKSENGEFFIKLVSILQVSANVTCLPSVQFLLVQ